MVKWCPWLNPAELHPEGDLTPRATRLWWFQLVFFFVDQGRFSQRPHLCDVGSRKAQRRGEEKRKKGTLNSHNNAFIPSVTRR